MKPGLVINEPRIISGYTGITLDGLRIAAALTVFIFHIFYHWFYSLAILYRIDNLAHAAVIIFFVLSGYLIAYTTTVTNRGGLQYAQARLSRLYSVVLPALFITGACEIIVRLNNPSMYSLFLRGNSLPRYIVSGLFMNEIWFFSAAPPINEPLWSLSFEFWYYVIFGLWFYRKQGSFSYVLPILACIIAGPKILLMMPVWLTGYLAYRLPRPRLQPIFSFLLIVSGFSAAILMAVYISPLPYKVGTPPLYFGSQFFTDWLIGFCIGFALWILPQGNKKFRLSKSLRVIADLTFSLYVLHNPLLIMWDAISSNKIHSVIMLWQPFLVILILSGLIGFALEKQRFLWTNLFKNLLQFYIKKRDYLIRCLT